MYMSLGRTFIVAVFEADGRRALDAKRDDVDPSDYQLKARKPYADAV